MFKHPQWATASIYHLFDALYTVMINQSVKVIDNDDKSECQIAGESVVSETFTESVLRFKNSRWVSIYHL